MSSFSLKRLIPILAAMILFGQAIQAHAADSAYYDHQSAVIFAYFEIGDDANPSSSLRREQFLEQIHEIREGSYTVKSLPDIVAAFKARKNLPDRTIALTFDGADRSLLTEAAPYLIDHEIPFTVFIPAAKISAGKPPYMSWDDLRALKKTGLVTFGLHPSGYGHLLNASGVEIKRQINTSLAEIRDQLKTDITLLAYPYGEYNASFKNIVQAMGFEAAFGQQSGVAYAGEDMMALPRFTQTERYGDLERFRMTANALPLPVRDVSPDNPHLTSLTPSIGFTVSEDMVPYLKNLSCFSSANDKPDVEIINQSRVEIRMKNAFEESRPRINCTLPVLAKGEEEPRWRWLGMLYTIEPDLLPSNETAMPELHASDSVDILIE